MKIQIQSSVVLESKLLTQSINRKIKAFAKDHKEIKEIDIKLKQDITTGNRTAEVYLKMTDKNIFAIQPGRTFDMAIDKSIVKLQNQLNRGITPSVITAEEQAKEQEQPEQEAEGETGEQA